MPRWCFQGRQRSKGWSWNQPNSCQLNTLCRKRLGACDASWSDQQERQGCNCWREGVIRRQLWWMETAFWGIFWAAGVISCFLGILEGFSVAIYFRKKNIPFEQWKQDPWLFRVYVGDDMLPIYMGISLETITLLHKTPFMKQPGFNGTYFLFHGSFDTCKIVKISHLAPTFHGTMCHKTRRNTLNHGLTWEILGYKFTKIRVLPWQLIYLLKISGWKMFFFETVPFRGTFVNFRGW